MKTTSTWKKFLGGSAAAAALAGGAIVAQAPVANAQSDWDRLAQCESGGNWSINTGNGFYGGLQFMKATWDSMGGQQYAEYPHQASKSEQIAVASKLQAAAGWGQWPSCSAQLGLSGSPSGGSGGGESTQQSQPQQQAPQPTQEAPQQSPAPAGEFTAEPNTDVEVSEDIYTISSGDTLGSIADEHDIDWKDLWGANVDEIEDPNLIFVGDELKLPVIDSDGGEDEG
ncbi:transglycosylase family protein [Nesterenkonia muleiensis]|uniref:LysM peptidoglycan-binding domain-containing protein n=1 Tax=Nesterenkonia muleiensis TaxID=2282648 RepID=UPI000E76EBC4|nr:transglycosylase family protein [Nesterenkonia muleiensis]